MKLKCIGGYNNGEYRDVPIERPINDIWKIVIQEPKVFISPIEQIQETTFINYETYIISVTKYQDATGIRHEFKFLRHEKLTNDEIMLRLLTQTFK